MGVMTKPVKDFMKILLYVILFTLIALSLIVFQLSKRLKGPFDQLIKRITSYDGSLSQEVINYEKAPIENRSNWAQI